MYRYGLLTRVLYAVAAQHCDGNAMTLVRLRVTGSGISVEVNYFYLCPCDKMMLAPRLDTTLQGDECGLDLECTVLHFDTRNLKNSKRATIPPIAQCQVSLSARTYYL